MDMPPTRAAAAALLLVCTVSTLACTRRDVPPREPPRDAAVSTPPAAAVPDSFLVALTTSRGPVAVVVHRSWAPHGVDRLYALVHAGFYDGARFFRVVRGFVVQFGLPADPQLGKSWSSQLIPDDPVRHPNRRGTVAFASAGPNTRTTQLFVNLADNLRLDALGFAPIGQVEGDAYLKRVYPNLDQIRTARIVGEWR